mmetsp:Transcript_5973/g.11285  ORF Transcript_5973/g.11285 Transcript_5973/m.11285 type:complete len:303 (+) Transcript_5973:348-1256(+)
MTDSTSKTAKCKSGANHQRITDFFCCFDSILKVIYCIGLSNFLIDFIQSIREKLTIFRVNDYINWSSEYLNIVFFKDTRFVHCNRTVQSCLSSHRNNNSIWFFLLNDLFNELWSHWKEVNMVSLTVRFAVQIGLNRSYIRVHKDNLLPFFFESLDCLSSRVIEFSCLTNRCSSRPKQEDFLGRTQWRGRSTHRKSNHFIGLLTGFKEGIKHEFSITWSTGCLWMELSCEVGPSFVRNTFITSIICIGEENLPTRLESVTVNMITMILRCNVTLSSLMVQNWLILASISKRKFFCLSTRSQSH